MPIYAPSLPSPPFYIGKHLLGGDGTQFQIFGYPIPNYRSNDVSSLPPPWSIVEPTSLFDVSSLDINHEVVVVLFAYNNYVYSDVNFSFNWCRQRDSYHITNLSFSTRINESASGVYCASWIGYCTAESFQEEIGENGGYYVDVSVSGGVNYSRRIYFTVKGIPVETSLENASTSSFDWKIKLSDYFDTNNYIRAGICTSSFSNGQTTTPNGILGYKYASSNSNGGTVAEGTATGLNPDTTYTVYGFAQTASGAYYNTGSAIIRTKYLPISAPTGLTQDIEGTTTSSIRVRWNKVAAAKGYKVYVLGAGEVLSTANTWADVSIVGLNPNDNDNGYLILVAAYNDNDISFAFDCAEYFWQRPSVPIKVSDSSTVNSIYVDWADQAKPKVTKWWCYWKLASEPENAYNNNASVVDISEATWFLPFQNTQYNIRIKAISINGLGQEIPSNPLDLTYTTLGNRPSNFYWSTNVASGVEFNLLANDWNALLNRINAFRRYKGLTDAGYNVASPGQNFMATQFNQAVNNMSSIPGIGTLPSTKASGNQVKASDLNLLVNTLNAIP